MIGVALSIAGGLLLKSYFFGLKEEATGSKGKAGEKFEKFEDVVKSSWHLLKENTKYFFTFGNYQKKELQQKEELETDAPRELNKLMRQLSQTKDKDERKKLLTSILLISQSVTTDALVAGIGATVMSAGWSLMDLAIQGSVMTAGITLGVILCGVAGTIVRNRFENRIIKDLEESLTQNEDISDELKQSYIVRMAKVQRKR